MYFHEIVYFYTYVVPEGGLEPPFPKGRRILSPLCLPISPLGPAAGLMLPHQPSISRRRAIRYISRLRRIACTYSRVSVYGIDSTNSGDILVVAARHPLPHRHIARVVSRQRVLRLPAETVQHLLQIPRAQLQVDRSDSAAAAV